MINYGCKDIDNNLHIQEKDKKTRDHQRQPRERMKCSVNFVQHPLPVVKDYHNARNRAVTRLLQIIGEGFRTGAVEGRAFVQLGYFRFAGQR